MRTFIAVELPSQFEGEVAAVARQLSAVIEARYIPRENYHITLAFLGETTEIETRDAIAALEESSAGMESFPLKPDGIGKFGKSHNATLWLGIAKTPELMELAERVREELHARGIEFDDKAFLPHITLARHADIPNVELPQLLFPQEVLAHKVTVFKSTLSKDGAIYKPLHTIEMQKSKTWQHEITGIDGNATLFGVNIFKYRWEDTGESVTVLDPLYGEEHEFRIYTVVIDGQKHEFASGEFSNCVWGFYLPKD